MKHTSLIRSFLFVPAANERLLQSALRKSSDAVILDLEDGTHPDLKPEARARLPESLKQLKEAGKLAAVRVNGEWLDCFTDLMAAVTPSLDILVLPKVEHPRDVHILSKIVAELEAAREIQEGKIRFLLQIESASALPRLHEIAAASPRNLAMMLGSEDYSLDCGALPTPDSLLYPSLQVLTAARAARIQPLGFVASIADLGSPEDFREVVLRARALGFRGAVVVHPKFVDVVNDCYTSTPEQIACASRLVKAFEEALSRGEGAIKFEGLMVDKPVYRRALELISEAEDLAVKA